MSMFMASDATPQRTLADIIMERINEAGVSGDATANVEGDYIALSTGLADSIVLQPGLLLKRYIALSLVFCWS
jgi:hypothetical protein